MCVLYSIFCNFWTSGKRKKTWEWQEKKWVSLGYLAVYV
jgi:hypothetical protein